MPHLWQCQGVRRPDTTAGAVRQGSLRELNLAVVLGRIAAAERPPSRAELASEAQDEPSADRRHVELVQ